MNIFIRLYLVFTLITTIFITIITSIHLKTPYSRRTWLIKIDRQTFSPNLFLPGIFSSVMRILPFIPSHELYFVATSTHLPFRLHRSGWSTDVESHSPGSWASFEISSHWISCSLIVLLRFGGITPTSSYCPKLPLWYRTLLLRH